MTNRSFVLQAFGIDTSCVKLMSELQVTDFRRRINTFLRPGNYRAR